MQHFLETKIPAPVVAAVIGAATKLYVDTQGIRLDPTHLRMLTGVGLSQLSALLVLVAVVTMWRARTTINPLDPERTSSLVTRGIYRRTRNPMYLSLLLLLVAYAVRLDSLAVWCGPVLFVAYVTRFQIHPEERVLRRKFGADYEDYLRSTRRWI